MAVSGEAAFRRCAAGAVSMIRWSSRPQEFLLTDIGTNTCFLLVSNSVESSAPEKGRGME
jgi:hypothetical protein